MRIDYSPPMPTVIAVSGRQASITRTIRGRVAIAGVGETAYYKHGQAPEPEVKLALQAILAACADAGIDPSAGCRWLCRGHQRLRLPFDSSRAPRHSSG